MSKEAESSAPKEPYKMNLGALGTIDEALTAAEGLAVKYDAIARNVFDTCGPDLGRESLLFQSMVVRIRGLHDGSVREIRAKNPHGTFPLVRAWSEACALLIYVTDKPQYIGILMETKKNLGPSGGRKSIQAIISHASKRMPGLKPIYDQLSEIAHFGSVAFWNPFDTREDDNGDQATVTLTWSSVPRWRNEKQALIACGWVHELAEASRHLLQEFAEAHLLPSSQ